MDDPQAARRCVTWTEAERQNRRLLQARDMIDRAYNATLDVRGLARIAYLSESQFNRSFKRAFGLTPHHYQQLRRIERAMTLLRDSRLPVTEIGNAVGYASLGTFSRTFTALVGSSPTTYRQTAAELSAPVCSVKRWSTPAGRSCGPPTQPTRTLPGVPPGEEEASL